MFNIDPNGTVQYKGVQVPTILCHWDSYKLGLGSAHSDIYGWFKKYNKDMNNVRADVAAILKATTPPPAQEPEPQLPPSTEEFKVGDLVGIKPGATYYTGKAIPSWVLAKKWYIKSIKGDRAVIDKSEDQKSSVNSPVNTKYLIKVAANTQPSTPAFEPYVIRVTANALNVRSGPGTNYSIKTVIYKNGVYTIVDKKNNWGKLKSGAGWICLDYTEKK